MSHDQRPLISQKIKRLCFWKIQKKKQYFSRAMDLVSLDIFEVFVEATH